MNRTINDIRENLDYVGCDNATAREMCDEIERLTEDNCRLGAVVIQTDAGELAEANARLNTFTQAVEIVTDPEHPYRAFGGGKWTMIATERYNDLLVAEEQLAERTEAARAMFLRATLGHDLFPVLERWPWLEEEAGGSA